MEAAPLTLRPTRSRIGERLGIAYFDGILFGAAVGADRVQLLYPRGRDAQ